MNRKEEEEKYNPEGVELSGAGNILMLPTGFTGGYSCLFRTVRMFSVNAMNLNSLTSFVSLLKINPE